MVQRKLNTTPMTIVMISQESNHDLQHDLGYMEYQCVSGTLMSVAGVVLQVINMHRLSGSFLEFAGSRIVSGNGCCERQEDSEQRAVANRATQREGQVGNCVRYTRLVLGLLLQEAASDGLARVKETRYVWL